ncbi:subtilisin-like protease SBT1.9 [Tripterygium wilfordii]|uniref:subtilisin-like protease SBT1.9 n=1 Tax=Tripterygium wilfordii TaxID=458696 RepID=UPI0018F850DF|nr:subtilisin-like protease SBT1.9 [Tripterygium wilfordii]
MGSSVLKLMYAFVFTIFSFMEPTWAESETYIIHMDLSAMPKVFSDHHSWYLSTLSSISSDTPTARSRHIYTYKNSMNGFSASLTPNELESLRKSPGFISFTRDYPLKMQTTHTSQFLSLTSASGAWPASKYGQDVIIGVVDTGVWPESESFNDDGMTEVPSRWKGKCESGTQFNSSLCNKKLIGARFYNKGLVAQTPDADVSMNSSRDSNGHGTHTASTAAGNYVKNASYFGYANGTANGVAPQARIAIYKVIWPLGIYSSDLIAAIDDAIEDGVDILSLSLIKRGDDEDDDDIINLDYDTVAIATFKAVEKGIFVAAAAGNGGPVEAVANGAPWLATVGAGTIDRDLGGLLTLGNGVQFRFPSLYPLKSSLNRIPLVFIDGCESVKELKKVKNKIVVCKDNLSFSSQFENADAAGVSGAIFITDILELDYYTRSKFPASFISTKDGQVVIEYIKKSSDPRATLEFQKTVIGTKPAPKVESYSQRGPSPSCPSVLKPDLIAPGTLIIASWSLNSSVTTVRSGDLYSNFYLDTGTSMATPHVAGVAALVKGVHPDWSPAAIRSALMTTANPLDNTLSPIKDPATWDLPATPLDIGAGHIDPNKAIEPGLVYDATAQDYIQLLCAMNYTAQQIRVITGSNHKCVNQSFDLNYPTFIAYFNTNDSNSDAKVTQVFHRTVTNVGEVSSTYIANLSSMDGVKAMVEPEKLVFKKKYQKISYKLTLEGPKLLKQNVVHGSLIWVADSGKYTVRSPIVATSIVPETSLRS